MSYWCLIFTIVLFPFSFAGEPCMLLPYPQADPFILCNVEHWRIIMIEGMRQLFYVFALVQSGVYNALLACTMNVWLSSIFIITTEFAEVPSNMIVELGTPPPPLRCRHTASEAIITWRVNGLPLGQFSDIISGSVNENGNRVDTLTIPAELQYNGTEVVCVAVFLDGSPTERTLTATILLFTTTSPTIAPGISPLILYILLKLGI